MDKRIEEVVDYSLLIVQTYVLIRIGLSRNPYFKTPFFFFFLLTGALGVLSVVGFIIDVRYPIPADRSWLYKTGYVMNIFGVMGSTVGKLYIVAHRYAVMRIVNLMEHIWSNQLTYVLTGVLIILSCIRCISVFFCDYAFIYREGLKLVQYFDDQCNFVDKSESSVTYFIYVIASVVLTTLTSRQLYSIQRKTEAETKKIILKQQRKMFIIVFICMISHLIKAVHQLCWVIAAYFHLSEFNVVLQATYVYPHYLATYSAHLILTFDHADENCQILRI